jgi:hypothetical protein
MMRSIGEKARAEGRNAKNVIVHLFAPVVAIDWPKIPVLRRDFMP